MIFINQRGSIFILYQPGWLTVPPGCQPRAWAGEKSWWGAQDLGPTCAPCLTLKRPTMRSSSVAPSSLSPVLPRSRLNVCSQSSKLSNSDSSSLGYT